MSAADKDGYTPLHGTVTKDLATVKVLHEVGGDIKACANIDATFLHQAASG